MAQSRYDMLLAEARHWAHEAVHRQWLRTADVAEIAALDERRPASMFETGSHRPLVAAFFGGTGVGKSSLLNRLAGRPVARTGVERPTSREVSLYLHESIHIDHLPGHLPLDRARVARHPDLENRQILWVDMPDIDSVEAHNREIVLDWLPHIDVLLYVVSPERYRDRKGWRVLREHGGEHAWLFIMNQWDRGQLVQLDDFRRLLGEAGFQDPVLLRTDSRPAPARRGPDDFDELRQLLAAISERHILLQIESRAESARLADLGESLAAALARLGPAPGYAALLPGWQALWDTTREELMTGLAWSLRAAAAAYADREANLLARSVDLSRTVEESSPRSPAPSETRLWDEWAEERVRDALAELMVAAGQAGLPIIPLRARLEAWPAETGRQVLRQGQLLLRQALARPGNGLQRAALKLMGALSFLLPLGALGWASYQVVRGYYESAQHHLGYLGTDFAVHSLLLIALSWLLPWFACTRLKPSMETCALRGLRSGVDAALESTGARIGADLEALEQERRSLLKTGGTIRAAIPPIGLAPTTGMLGRLLSQPGTDIGSDHVAGGRAGGAP